MKTVTVKWTGVRPLIMSNPQTVDVENAYSAESRRINAALKAARKKGDEDKLVELARLQKRNDFESSAYWDSATGRFFVPDVMIAACLTGGARSLKKGKDIDRAVIIEEEQVPVGDVPPVKSLAAAGQNPVFVLECPAKVPPKTGALFIKRRCMMPTGWSLTFRVAFDEQMIAEKTLFECMRVAGEMVGIGGWRPRFGRFVVEVLR